MREEESIENLLQQVTLKPPTPQLKQTVLQAAEQAESSGEAIGHRLSLGWWGAIAACLAMVLLTHWYCERQLNRWTHPVYSQPLPQQDASVLEELGWGTDASHRIRLSRQFVPERSRGAGEARFQLQQLLNEFNPAHRDEPRDDPPHGQSRHHRIDFATQST